MQMAEAGTNEEPGGESKPGSGGSGLRWVWLALAAYILFRWTVGVVRLPISTPPGVLLPVSALVALGSIGLPIALIAALARVRIRGLIAVLIAVFGLALWFGLVGLARLLPPAVLPLVATLQDLGKVLAAGGAGLAFAAPIREPNILVPAGVFAAFADFVVVNFGTVHQALKSTRGQAMIEAVSAKVPSVHPGLMTLTIGPADFLFLGIFLACAAKFGMGLRRNAVVLALVLAASLVLIQANIVGALPALAPMSIAFVGLNWRRFRLTREEIVSTAVVIVFAGALFLGYFLFVFPKK
ncbi:MAG: hypothetical protein K0Q72_1698 [Armatimonadetes bacterium]|nr:hypothetical protein [Armatimonadota bacterium]